MNEVNGGARRDRTDDLMLAKHALSQLSYGPKHLFAQRAKNATHRQMIGTIIERCTAYMQRARTAHSGKAARTHEPNNARLYNADRSVARIWLPSNAFATGLLAHAKRPLVGSPQRPQDRRSEDVQKGDPEGHQIEDLVGRGGLEPPTSRLSGVRSNHLSYRPISEHGAKRPRSSGTAT